MLWDAFAPAPAKRSLENPSTPLSAFFSGGVETTSGLPVDETALIKNLTTVFGIFRIFSEAESMLPDKPIQTTTRRRGGKTITDRNELTSHPTFDLLQWQANPLVNAIQFRQTRMLHLMGWGNFYAEIQRTVGGRPAALWPIHPSLVTRVVKDRSDSYVVRVKGRELIVPSENMGHGYGMSLDGYTGISVLRSFRNAGALAISYEKYLAKFMMNDATPAGILSTENAVDSNAYERMKKSWGEVHGGVDNSHKMAILEQGLKFQAISINPVDAALLAGRAFQEGQFCQLYKCPPHLLAILTDATYNNIAVLDTGFVKFSLMPYLKMLAQTDGVKMLTPLERQTIKLEHVVSDLLKGDPATEAIVFKEWIRSGVLTPDQVRADTLKLNPREDGHGGRYRQPVQEVWADTIDETAAAARGAAPAQRRGVDGLTEIDEEQALRWLEAHDKEVSIPTRIDLGVNHLRDYARRSRTE